MFSGTIFELSLFWSMSRTEGNTYSLTKLSSPLLSASLIRVALMCILSSCLTTVLHAWVKISRTWLFQLMTWVNSGACSSIYISRSSSSVKSGIRKNSILSCGNPLSCIAALRKSSLIFAFRGFFSVQLSLTEPIHIMIFCAFRSNACLSASICPIWHGWKRHI